jgi:hypothetical protein
LSDKTQRLVGDTHKPRFVRSCRAIDSSVDFAAERPEIDRFGQKRLGAVLQRSALRLRMP